ncbi:MAG: hypothetical protein FJ271_18865 [Planctomycetes bacterium]|nr:hypothetical protein [Planctomycetota bacterium]
MNKPKKLGWLGVAAAVILPLAGLRTSGVLASGWRKADNELYVVSRKLHGTLVDFTFNHGKDNRMWSRSLEQRRDMYVYLPPGYDPQLQYPIMILMHGFASDEQTIFRIAPELDSAMVKGTLPPFIVAVPDGSLTGEPCLLTPGSFFLNSEAGAFEDFILQDVWDFMIRRYRIRPERNAHVLAGVSMGGFGAYSLGIRHREGFGVVVGVNAPLNLRWVDKQQRYFSDFDPYNWGWREQFRPHEPVGRFMGGLLTIRVKHMLGNNFGKDDEATQQVSAFNPIELIDRTRLRNGELAMYIAYAGQDEFNIDAQVESFLYVCKHRGLEIGVGYKADGKHDSDTAIALLPGVFYFLTPILSPYSPGIPISHAQAPAAAEATPASAQPVARESGPRAEAPRAETPRAETPPVPALREPSPIRQTSQQTRVPFRPQR